MKKIVYLIKLLIFFAFTSCEMTEEITFNENSSGKLSYSYDMSKLMEFIPEDIIEKKTIDSTIVFKDLLENPEYNMTPEERKIIESIKNVTMYAKMDTVKKEAKMSFSWNFKNINENPDFLKKIRQALEIDNPMAESSIFKSMTGENQKVKYNFDGTKLSRNVTIKKELNEDEIKEFKQMLDQDEKTKGLSDVMKYTIKLNFTKPIKSINSKNVTFTNNKKTVVISYKIEDFLKNPKKLNLEVQLVD